MELISLDKLIEKESGIIQEIRGSSPLRKRFMELGCLRGELITVVKYAPLGDPVEYKIKGYNLSFRKDEAKNILVKKTDELE